MRQIDTIVLIFILIHASCGVRVGNSNNFRTGSLKLEIASVNQTYRSLNLKGEDISFTDINGESTVISIKDHDLLFGKSGTKSSLLGMASLPATQFEKVILKLSEDDQHSLEHWDGSEIKVKVVENEWSLSESFSLNQGETLNLIVVVDIAASLDIDEQGSLQFNGAARLMEASKSFLISTPADSSDIYGCLYNSDELPSSLDDCREALQVSNVENHVIQFRYLPAGLYAIRIVNSDGQYRDVNVNTDDGSTETENPGLEPVSKEASDYTPEEIQKIEGIFDQALKRAKNKARNFQTCSFPTNMPASAIEWLIAHKEEISSLLDLVTLDWNRTAENHQCNISTDFGAPAISLSNAGCYDMTIAEAVTTIFHDIIQGFAPSDDSLIRAKTARSSETDNCK